jgi:outer membrane protein OmpA-like peptidoglycan-associated protein
LSALVPLVLIGLATTAFPFLTRGCATKDTPVVRAPDVRVPDVKGPDVKVPDVKAAAPRVAAYRPDLSKLVALKLPDGASLEIPGGSFLSGIHKYLTDVADTRPRDFVFESVTFDGPAVKTGPETETPVKGLAALLKAFPGVTLHITGHTDNAGDPDANRRLSLDRANAVKDLLVKAGAPADRIRTEGLGGEKPVAPNDKDENRARNRRVELTIAKQ